MTAQVGPRPPVPVGAIGTQSSGWWGAWFLLLSELALFSYVIFSYYYYAVQPQADWIPGPPPSFHYSGPQSGLVLAGCLTAWGARRFVAERRPGLTLLCLGLTTLFGATFVALQFLDWWSKPFNFDHSTYSSMYFLLSGLHLAHFLIGLLAFLGLFLWSALGYFDETRHAPITVGALYWYFLALTWFSVFFVLFGSPYVFPEG